MSHLVKILCLIVLVSVPLVPQKPNSVMVYSGFLNAGEFHGLPEAERMGYALGYFNGLMSAPFLEANPEKVRLLHECVGPMRSSQIEAILSKHIQNNPERWHESLANESFNAMLDACPSLVARMKQDAESSRH
jgi:hypothetical protein